MAKKSTKTWIYAPKKPPKEKLPDDLKAAVEVQASELVEKVLKPRHIQPPPQRAKVQLRRRRVVKMARELLLLWSHLRLPWSKRRLV